MNQIKPASTSKTNWLNIITGVAGVLSLPQVNSIIPTPWTPYILLANTALNLILRNFFTSQPTTQFAANNTPPTNG